MLNADRGNPALLGKRGIYSYAEEKKDKVVCECVGHDLRLSVRQDKEMLQLKDDNQTGYRTRLILVDSSNFEYLMSGRVFFGSDFDLEGYLFVAIWRNSNH